MAGEETHSWILHRLRTNNHLQFEKTCVALLTAEGHDPVEHRGLTRADRGVDILSQGPDGRWWATQCKRYKKLNASDILPGLDQVLEDPPTPTPEVYLVAAPCGIPSKARKAITAKALAGGMKEVRFWDSTALEQLLTRYDSVRTDFIGRDEHTPLRFWNVPNRNPYFTGRKDLLAELESRLRSEGSAVLTQAITGLGGVGKTQTAIEFCHQHRDAYQGGVFWTVATSSDALEAEFAKLAAELALVTPGTPIEDAANAFRGNLSRRDGWLLVLDNADSTDDLKPQLPRTSTGQVLVTTRLRITKFGPPLGVEVLPEGEALELLVFRSGRGEDEQEAARDLVEQLGYLPLAIEQAGAFLANFPMPIATYLEGYRQRRLGVLRKAEPEAGDYHSRVSATWIVSFEALAKESAVAAAVLEACAFLAPEEIPLELFKEGGESVHSALGDLDDFGIQESLLGPLTRYSLATYDQDGKTLSIHRLVQEVIREDLEREGRSLEVLQGAHQALDAAFPQQPETPESWPVATRLFAHVQEGVPRWESHASEERDPTHLWLQTGHCAWALGRYSAAHRLFESALEVRRRVLGPEHPNTLGSISSVAMTLHALGDLSGSRELRESVLEVRRRVLGPEHPDTLISMNDLAATLADLGDLSDARELQELALEICRRVLGPEHPDTLISMNNLAATLADLGDLSGARELHESELEICRRVLGPEHLETLISMNNLAFTLRKLGDLSGARELLESALKVRRRVLGPEHPATLQSIGNLSSIHFSLGEHEEASKMDRELLETRRRILGPEHPGTLGTLHNLATNLKALKSPDLKGVVAELLAGVRKFPEGVPVREHVLKYWATDEG